MRVDSPVASCFRNNSFNDSVAAHSSQIVIGSKENDRCRKLAVRQLLKQLIRRGPGIEILQDVGNQMRRRSRDIAQAPDLAARRSCLRPLRSDTRSGKPCRHSYTQAFECDYPRAAPWHAQSPALWLPGRWWLRTV